MKTKPASPGNPQENAIIERIHQVPGNLACTYNIQETYVDDAYPWMVILSAAAYAVHSTYHTAKDKSTIQLVFGRDMILPINHVSDWRYIRQSKQAQIDNDVIHENTTRIDHDYRVGDKVTTKTKSAYKKILFKSPYEIVHTWTNITATLQTGAVTTRINLRNIKPYNITIVEGCDPS